jgi:hypothetical protein
LVRLSLTKGLSKALMRLTFVHKSGIMKGLFGAVVGSTPVVVLLPVAILLLALIEMVGRKVKGDDMTAKTIKAERITTITTKRRTFIRGLSGQILMTTAAIGVGMTAGEAGLQL